MRKHTWRVTSTEINWSTKKVSVNERCNKCGEYRTYEKDKAPQETTECSEKITTNEHGLLIGESNDK